MPFHGVKYVSQSHRHAPASVLLAVLCLLAVLSFLIITTAAMSREHGEMQLARTSMMRARQLAESGIAVASHPLIQSGDPLLQNQVSAIESYDVKVTTEERLLNLNALLTSERLPLLERIFISWGLSLVDAQDIAATFMDWTDADDLKRRPGSAESLDYQQPGLPPNRPFTSLEELDQVARVAELDAARPDWRTWFTLRGNGQLDLNTAPAEIIAALTGTSLENARQLVSTRDGPEGAPFKSLEEAAAILGIAKSDTTNLLTVQGPTRHVESIGRAGDAHCGIALVLDLKGGTPRMVEWKEFSVKGPLLP